MSWNKTSKHQIIPTRNRGMSPTCKSPNRLFRVNSNGGENKRSTDTTTAREVEQKLKLPKNSADLMKAEQDLNRNTTTKSSIQTTVMRRASTAHHATTIT
jgi:hypothetical protein